MKYCGSCAKEILGVRVDEGKLSFHGVCYNKRKLVETMPIDKHVKHIGENRITGDLEDATARIQMINDPQPHLVRVK